MNKDLIFDIGCHKGEDTAFYLKCGYSVVAIDALLKYIEEMREKFIDSISRGKLFLENCLIGGSFSGFEKFYESSHSDWCSAHLPIASRFNTLEAVHRIEKKPLSYFFNKYGTPYYCKIDIEGSDLEALQSLDGMNELPKYISCETECLGENRELTEGEITANLVCLRKLGYTGFKLIEQNSFHGIYYDDSFDTPWRIPTGLNNGYDFQVGSSGGFGEMLQGNWMDFAKMRETLLKFREYWFRHNELKCSFWCDLHATY